jgi:hypothetical protein
MGLKVEKDLKVIFSKKLKEIIIHPLLCFFVCCDIQKTFIALQFARPMTQKLLHFG